MEGSVYFFTRMNIRIDGQEGNINTNSVPEMFFFVSIGANYETCLSLLARSNSRKRKRTRLILFEAFCILIIF